MSWTILGMGVMLVLLCLADFGATGMDISSDSESDNNSDEN